ncbi:MAG: hypothetical protein KI791_10720, partial [Cyclobacteriaceae bacterium]|nr:hypothetical protein [Cyclobacteriaceae bacterium SS2]
MRYLPILIFLIFVSACTPQDPRSMEPLVISPFEGLDTLAINDWWNRGENPIIDMDVPREEVVAFGIYTVANQKLKMTAQLYPLFPNEDREVRLEVDQDGWKEIATAKINDLGWSATFVVQNWDDTRDIPYRIRHGEKAMFEGLVRKDP